MTAQSVAKQTYGSAKPSIRWGLYLYAQLFSVSPAPTGRGAWQGGLYGEKGTGKSTLLANLARDFIDAGIPVIWRGRSERDAFSFVDREATLFFHEADNPTIFETTNTGRMRKVKIEYETYTDVPKLINKQLTKKLNVIYPPSSYNEEYEPSNGFIKRLISKRPSIDIEELLKSSISIFWFEVADYLPVRKDKSFITFIFDEIPEWIRSNEGWLKYHLNKYHADRLNDYRGNNIFHFYTTHDDREVEWEIDQTKIEYAFYFRGARVKPRHKVKQSLVDYVIDGYYWIAHGPFYGLCKIKFPAKPKVYYVYADEKGEIPF